MPAEVLGLCTCPSKNLGHRLGMQAHMGVVVVYQSAANTRCEGLLPFDTSDQGHNCDIAGERKTAQFHPCLCCLTDCEVSL